MTIVPLVSKREGDDGLEGSALHFIAHTLMKSQLGAVGELGAEPVIPPSVHFSHWVADYYYRFVSDTVPRDWSLEVEAALETDFPGFLLTGHIDAIAMSPDGTEAIGFDLKTGYDPVDVADSNEQILGYSVLLKAAYPELRKLTFWIIQPRNDEDEGFPRCSSVVIEGELLDNCATSLASRLTVAIANNMEVSTSMKACKWCSAAMQCPAQIELRELMKAKLTPELLEKIKATPDDAALGDWVISGRSLNRPIEDAEAMFKERIRANGSLTAGDGTFCTIKEEGGSYSFPDPVAFYRESRKLLPEDEIYATTVKPSVTRTIDALGERYQLPKNSKNGPSARTMLQDSPLGSLCVQGKREKIVFHRP